MRDSTIIYRSFYEAIKELPKSNQAEVWQAIFEFSLNFNEVELSGLSKTIFTLIKPQLEANIKRYKNGIKPKGEQEESKSEAKPKQDEGETQANENDNEKVNDNVKYADFVARFNKQRGTNFRGNGKLKASLKARLKENYSIEDIIMATAEAMTEQHHIESNFKFLTPEFMTRPDKLERYLQQARSKSQPADEGKPDMTNWTPMEIYKWRIENEQGFRAKYNSANMGQYNSTEEEKRTTLKDFFDQETLEFIYAR